MNHQKMNHPFAIEAEASSQTILSQECLFASLLKDDNIICAHVYDANGYSEFLFHGSPENIANFIGARPFVNQIVLTDPKEQPFLWTIGYFIDRCSDMALLEEVKSVLIPIQKCEVKAQPVFSPSIAEVVAYQMRQQTFREYVDPDCGP